MCAHCLVVCQGVVYFGVMGCQVPMCGVFLYLDVCYGVRGLKSGSFFIPRRLQKLSPQT